MSRVYSIKTSSLDNNLMNEENTVKNPFIFSNTTMNKISKVFSPVR